MQINSTIQDPLNWLWDIDCKNVYFQRYCIDRKKSDAMDTVPTIPAAAPLMWLFLLVILTRKQKPGMTLVKLLMRELKWAELHPNLGISNWLFNLPI